MIRKLIGLAPSRNEDGSYNPSPVSLKMAAPSKTDYRQVNFERSAPDDRRRILMICTEEKFMEMENGKKFATGNHPVEMLLPVLHLQNAGFEVEPFTPNGRPAAIEEWALPEKDEQVMAAWDTWKKRLEEPRSLKKFSEKKMKEASGYAAVFIPGGHGAMLGLPVNKAVGEVIRWAYGSGMYVLAICHGPAALLATGKGDENFLFNGYKMAAFPDSADRKLPWIGYLPGQMPWHFGEKLRELGVTIVNKMPDDTCHADRRLITGASPQAANALGKLAVTEMLKDG